MAYLWYHMAGSLSFSRLNNVHIYVLLNFLPPSPPKKRDEENTPKLILQGQHYQDTQARESHYKKEKITDQHL